MNNNNVLKSFFRTLLRYFSEAEIRDTHQREKEYEKEISHRNKELRVNKSGVVVNGVLTLITLVVLVITVIQTRISSDAVTIAKDALIYQRYSDSLSSIQDAVKFDLQKKSLDLSIQTLRDSRNRFNAEHESFLEIRDFKVDFPNPATNPNITYTMSNYGRVIYVKQLRFGYEGGPTQDSVASRLAALSMMTKSRFLPYPVYLGEQTPKPLIKEWDVNLKRFKEILKESYTFYFCGEIRYVNLTNKQPMKMSFMLSTKVINEIKYQIISTKNEIDR